jgi:hypothetical protein
MCFLRFLGLTDHVTLEDQGDFKIAVFVISNGSADLVILSIDVLTKSEVQFLVVFLDESASIGYTFGGFKSITCEHPHFQV